MYFYIRISTSAPGMDIFFMSGGCLLIRASTVTLLYQVSGDAMILESYLKELKITYSFAYFDSWLFTCIHKFQDKASCTLYELFPPPKKFNSAISLKLQKFHSTWLLIHVWLLRGSQYSLCLSAS